ncbi:MAG: energy-coupled thiamine transporter ThiT [Clostridiales bacterium]|nr:energy-coupled thiamine transporter ThiT [Clostridiales bacterium]MDY5348510.1 energy-coupled thiamine transporter ThiT [Candidatus Ventricola sp.]MDY5513904.1 energy-coupled thiamine transporter ThiT [Candidatus Ventricola sp.]
MFSKFAEISPVVWGILAALVILGLVLFFVTRDSKKWSTRMLANAALCIALSFVLSYIRLYKLPQGGSITLASMLPLFLFAYAYGVGPGMLVGAAYGILQFIQDAYFVHPIELLLDYPLAFAMLGLAGLASRFSDKWGLIPGIVLGTFGRFVCAFLSGVIFFGMYAPEGQSVLVYSAVYNGFYLIPESIICIVLAMVPQIRRLAKQLALSK